MAGRSREVIRVEINEQTLRRLLSAGHVCAADFYCLDWASKQRLWRLCLEACRTEPVLYDQFDLTYISIKGLSHED